MRRSVTQASQATSAYSDALSSLGVEAHALTAQLNEVVTQQAYMMATNDFFRISAVAFAVLAVLVWITKPKKGAGPSMGH